MVCTYISSPNDLMVVTMCACTCTVDTEGFVKVLSDKKTDRMLGVHMIGSVSDPCCIYYINCHLFIRLLASLLMKPS